MFRGIEPSGLIGLAAATVAAADRMRIATRPALAVLAARGRPGPAADLAATGERIAHWGGDTATTLRWRAATIRQGQEAGMDIGAMLLATFAAEGMFTMPQQAAAYRDWIASHSASRERVDATIVQITRWLSQGWTDWDVGNRDLHHIGDTLASLRSDELDRVIAALNPGQVQRWIAEMGHSGNGFSRDEKSAVFAMLAAKASGASLGTIHDAVLAAGGHTDAVDLGAVIAAHSSDDVIVDFVAYAVAQNLADTRYSGLAPAQAIGGLRSTRASSRLARVLATTEESVLHLLTDAALMEDFHPGIYETVVSSLTRSTDAAARTTIFATLVGFLRYADVLLPGHVAVRSGLPTDQDHPLHNQAAGEVAERLLAAASRLLQDDPNGVFQRLGSTVDPDGSQTATFWYLLAADGRGDVIGGILDSLRGGENVSLDLFCDEGQTPDYPFAHARNLAFTAATLNLAFSQQAREAREDIDMISRIAGVLGSALGLMGGSAPLLDFVAGSGIDLTLDHAGQRNQEKIDESLAQLIDAIVPRLLPDEDAAVATPGHAGALRAWLDVYTRLLPFA